MYQVGPGEAPGIGYGYNTVDSRGNVIQLSMNPPIKLGLDPAGEYYNWGQNVSPRDQIPRIVVDAGGLGKTPTNLLGYLTVQAAQPPTAPRTELQPVNSFTMLRAKVTSERSPAAANAIEQNHIAGGGIYRSRFRSV